jgi:ATP-binding cassette subfamily B protein
MEMATDPRQRALEEPAVSITAADYRETWRLFRYVLPYRGKFLAGQVCLLIATLAGLGFPFFTGRLIDSAYRGTRSMPSGFLRGAAAPDANMIVILLLMTLAVQAACTALQTYWLAAVGERSLADFRRDIYGHLIRLPMAFFNSRRVGELSSRLTSDLGVIHGTLTGAIPSFFGQLVVLGGGLILIGLTSVRLTLVMLSTLPVSIGMAMILGKRTRTVSRETLDRLAATNVIVEETLQGIACVKAFANEHHESDRYRAAVEASSDVVLRGARYQGAFGAFITFALFGSILPTIWYGSRLVEVGLLTFGDMTQFLLYTTYIGGSLGQFTRLYGEWNRALGATHRVRELWAEIPEELGESIEVAACRDDNRAEPPARLAGDVAFDGVTFSYPSRPDVMVLRNLSLEARAGQRIALVGRSGAGKSTIVSLLMRFYDPDLGHVCIDGRNARELPLRHLRSQVAIVPQDVLLFGGTIAENIAYGKPGASPEEIEKAAREANAHGFIEGFPDGYQTRVGDRGVKLSGGQRQRVAIARAILKDPAILILDEATSSLDSESEVLVQQALERLMRGRTSVIIAHRLATVRRADRIFVIQQGEVVEAGTHEQLQARSQGLYRTLSELQFQA